MIQGLISEIIGLPSSSVIISPLSSVIYSTQGFVGVIVTVGVGVGVSVLVGVGVGPLIVNVKLSTGQKFSPQSGQSGLNISKVSFNRLKLCFTSGADNGEIYILN